ncbi:MAG: TIM barrel protein [Armatimonadetes bacterium]|nr:TIM barrel protein [Armatimonadota bacterium]
MAQELALGVMTQFHQPPREALEAVRALDIPTVQVGYPGQLDSADGVAAIQDASAQTGVEITTVFCGYAGESYADIPTVQATVGLVPPSTRAARLDMTHRIADFARRLGVARVAAHIGFVPEDAADPAYRDIVETIQGLCDRLAGQGQVFALETGQETARGLRQFIGDVGRPNLRVNFDPANMILYGKDKPIPALDLLMPWIDGVHCKDGRWPTQPGQLGEETPLGQGDVDLRRWLHRLIELGYRGPLTIEREISGEQQRRDIAAGRDLIRSLIAE